MKRLVFIAFLLLGMGFAQSETLCEWDREYASRFENLSLRLPSQNLDFSPCRVWQYTRPNADVGIELNRAQESIRFMVQEAEVALLNEEFHHDVWSNFPNFERDNVLVFSIFIGEENYLLASFHAEGVYIHILYQ